MNWLLENTSKEDTVSYNIRRINLWQIRKRMGVLTIEEKKEALKIAEDTSQEESIRVGANLILDNQIAAESHFEKLSEAERQSLREYPIFRYWIS